MERLDPQPGRTQKKSSLMTGIAAAVIAGLITFLLLFSISDLNGGVSGMIGAGVAIVTGGIVSAITLPTPRRER
ncbi:MAG: hypothetical protein ACTHWA_04230 [Arachnia sp.]